MCQHTTWCTLVCFFFFCFISLLVSFLNKPYSQLDLVEHAELNRALGILILDNVFVFNCKLIAAHVLSFHQMNTFQLDLHNQACEHLKLESDLKKNVVTVVCSFWLMYQKR